MIDRAPVRYGAARERTHLHDDEVQMVGEVEEDAPDIEVDAEVLAGCFMVGKVEVEKC